MLLEDFLQRERADALLLRGTEGEPFADPRRQPRLDVFIDGARDAHLSCAAQEGVLAAVPELPRGDDAVATVGYVRAVLDGALPLPAPLARQVEALRGALERLAPAGA